MKSGDLCFLRQAETWKTETSSLQFLQVVSCQPECRMLGFLDSYWLPCCQCHSCFHLSWFSSHPPPVLLASLSRPLPSPRLRWYTVFPAQHKEHTALTYCQRLRMCRPLCVPTAGSLPGRKARPPAPPSTHHPSLI